MIGTRHLARVPAHAQRAQGKLVLVGDPKQLPSIDAAGLYPLLARRGDAIILTNNHRQHDPADRDALTSYRRYDIGQPQLTVTSEDLGERTFQAGDHVVLRRNDYRLSVRNGEPC